MEESIKDNAIKLYNDKNYKDAITLFDKILDEGTDDISVYEYFLKAITHDFKRADFTSYDLDMLSVHFRNYKKLDCNKELVDKIADILKNGIVTYIEETTHGFVKKDINKSSVYGVIHIYREHVCEKDLFLDKFDSYKYKVENSKRRSNKDALIFAILAIIVLIVLFLLNVF